MTQARKLAAIMAVDVVGYSRLMGVDETGTADAVRARREAAAPIISDKGGRIVKTMGDGLLVEFPSVVAAIEAAIQIQTMMAELNESVPEAKRIIYRIGVHIGDVLIEGEDILGDGVNIAARLENVCEPGGVLISSDAYRQVEGRVEAEFADLGEKSLKNIARSVRVYGWRCGVALAEPLGDYNPPPLSVVVLPFANVGGGPEQDKFVDGVTESLTIDLSRMRGAFVIGPSTSFVYKGKAIDVKQIGRDLNVRYVLEGSLQRGGDRMRVSVQLIDAESGAHVWGERFDMPNADPFDMQDEIVSRLAKQLLTELVARETRRTEDASHPTAIDLVFQGIGLASTNRSQENLEAARAVVERVVTLGQAFRCRSPRLPKPR